ncbi:hypothetical protein [Burkholderia ubonensis]|uniref:hypothetical protein n=1 Tax=Burkholderia ubonensis TaxID=101571 RepID=UPI000A62ECE4|nr:hypothetical protein [Burkholderia ubonensis]
MIRVHVWYNAKGAILAVGHAPHGDRARYVVPLFQDGHCHLDADVDECQLKRLHETHKVDIERKILTERVIPDLHED